MEDVTDTSKVPEKMSDGDKMDRPADIPADLLVKIRSYLTEKPHSFEKLKAITNWCAQSKEACDERVYYEVVTKCIGVPPTVEVPRVPLPWPSDEDWSNMFISRGHAIAMDKQMDDAAESGTFWRTMMVNCEEGLSRLPPSIRGPFLNSNEAQRARWLEVFGNRGLVWLQARVALGGSIEPAPYPNYDSDNFDEQFPFQSDDWWGAHNFVRGACVERNFEQRVNGWIEEGWKFDWVLGSVFMLGLRVNELEVLDTEEAQTRVATCFKDRVEALISAGAEPRIMVEELVNALPDANKHIEYEKHYEFRFLREKVNLLLKHKIFVDFNREPYNEYRSRMVFMKLVRCFLQVAPQVKSWRRHSAELDEKYFSVRREEARCEEYNDQEKARDSLFVDQAKARDALFDSYQYELTRELCKLIVHLASPEGSNVHEKARRNMRRLIVQGFFDLFTTTGIRPGVEELYDWLRLVDGGFGEWPWRPNVDYVDGVYQGWFGEEGSGMQ